MSEHLGGHQLMDQRAATAITETNARAAAELTAAQVEANAMNIAFDQSKAAQAKAEAIETRRTSPEVQEMNQAAEIAIFGSRGRTEGYVDSQGKPLSEPIEGEVDKLRDTKGIAQRRNFLAAESERRAAVEARDTANVRHQYATPISETQESIDKDEAAGNANAGSYVRQVEALQQEGFELTQAKLILDLRGETINKQSRLYAKLYNSYKDKMDPSDASDKAAEQVTELTLSQGNNDDLVKRVIKQEGLFDRKEYNKFRFKHGHETEGEREGFVAYKQEFINAVRDDRDQYKRNTMRFNYQRKKLAKEKNNQYNADHMEAHAMNAALDTEKARRDATLVNNPVVDPTPKGLRNRARNIMAKAGAFLSVGLMNAREYFTDDEKGTRRKVVAGVAGALATAGLAYLELKGSGVSQHAVDHAPKGHGQGASEVHLAAHGNNETNPSHASHLMHHHGIHEAKQHSAVLKLDQRHPAIENRVAQYLHTDLKDPNVGKVTETILHSQGLSWNDAHRLPVGYSFNMPPQHVLEELLRNSKEA